ncbi:hypothetical protein RUM44_006015 [Polyplax serrata]|uniref:Uncharacterized protein n=1 Tax=Polyplax serrata TaxID=468196 RepID=A0ABR1AYR1_POLSC
MANPPQYFDHQTFMGRQIEKLINPSGYLRWAVPSADDSEAQVHLMCYKRERKKNCEIDENYLISAREEDVIEGRVERTSQKVREEVEESPKKNKRRRKVDKDGRLSDSTYQLF